MRIQFLLPLTWATLFGLKLRSQGVEAQSGSQAPPHQSSHAYLSGLFAAAPLQIDAVSPIFGVREDKWSKTTLGHDHDDSGLTAV